MFWVIIGIAMLWEVFVAAHVQVYTGGHFRELQPLALYESSIPLTYIINHNSFDNIETSNFPLPTNPFSNRYLTKLTAMTIDLNQLIERQQRRMAPRLNISSVTSRTQRAIESIGSFLNWAFGVSTDAQLHSLLDNEEAVNKHLNSLQDVVKGDHLDLVHTVSDMKGFSANVSQVLAKVSMVIRGMANTMKDRVPEEGMYKNMLTYILRIQAQLYRSLFLIDFEDTLFKCRANLLSTSVVSRDVLTSDIGRLEEKIRKDGFEIALSITNMEIFYTLPLTSCNISPEKLIVTLKIPVKRREDYWSLYEYIPSPLAWKNFTCVLSRETIYVASSRGKFVTIAGRQLDNCREGSTRMCQIPRQRQGGSISTTCVEKMFKKGTVDDLRISCPFFCDATRRGVLVTEVGFDSYIITHPTKDLYLNCSNSSFKIPTHYPGAFEVNLPCDCILTEGNSTLISKKYPCNLIGSDPEITHILPVSWTSLNNISLDPLEKLARPNFQNYSDVLDLNWNLATPAYVIHNNIPETAFDHVALPKAWYDIYDEASFRYYFIFGWLGLLSIINLYNVVKLYIMKEITKLQPPVLPPRTRK